MKKVSKKFIFNGDFNAQVAAKPDRFRFFRNSYTKKGFMYNTKKQTHPFEGGQ